MKLLGSLFNSHMVNAPHMAQVSNDQFQFRNHHWVSVCTMYRWRVEGSKQIATIFLLPRFLRLRSQNFLRRLFIIAIKRTFTIIDCIGNFDVVLHMQMLASYTLHQCISYYGLYVASNVGIPLQTVFGCFGRSDTAMIDLAVEADCAGV